MNSMYCRKLRIYCESSVDTLVLKYGGVRYVVLMESDVPNLVLKLTSMTMWKFHIIIETCLIYENFNLADVLGIVI